MRVLVTRRIFHWFLMAGVLMLGFGCGGGRRTLLSGVDFSPDPGSVEDGICTSEAQLISNHGMPISLLFMSAFFSDSEGREARYTLNAEELSVLLPSLEVGSRSVMSVPLTFPLGADGLELPAEGSVTFGGSSPDGIFHFVGSLTCPTSP